MDMIAQNLSMQPGVHLEIVKDNRIYGRFGPPIEGGAVYEQYHPELNSTIRLQYDQREIKEELRGIMLGNAIMLFLISIAMFTIALYGGRVLFINRLEKVSAGAKALGDGDLDYRICDNSKDEIGLLASSFNKMADELQAAITKIDRTNSLLEEKVKQRTLTIARQKDELLESNAQLQRSGKKLRSYTEQLKKSNEDLLAFTKELQRSNEELDEFAHIASHDLKEPLRGIASYSQFLLEDYEDQLDEEGVMRLHTLVKLTKRMDGLIESLLYFSSVGRSEAKIAEIDPKRLIESVRDSLVVSLEQGEVDLRIPSEMPTITCDFVRVEEVFRNLISNSIKYNDKEERYIEVGSESYCKLKHGSSLLEDQDEPEEGCTLYFVRDNGIGVRERNRETVFKLFRRLHGRDKFGGGHGAGLPIVKKIIEQHGGIIWLESEFGEGTTFYFTLPHAPNNSLSTGSK